VIVMVGLIRDELAKVDAANASTYRKNAEEYIDKLKKLLTDGRKMLADKKVKRIISFHDAFEYFASGFGLHVEDVIEVGLQSPSPFHLARLEKLCRQPDRPIGAITVEPQFPDANAARQLQKALRNARPPIVIPLVSIDPLETADRDELKNEGAGWYEKRMRQNLEALDKVLK
jgi:zinc transport system substrate-binding protein